MGKVDNIVRYSEWLAREQLPKNISENNQMKKLINNVSD